LIKGKDKDKDKDVTCISLFQVLVANPTGAETAFIGLKREFLVKTC
jgi:hypothetical protein